MKKCFIVLMVLATATALACKPKQAVKESVEAAKGEDAAMAASETKKFEEPKAANVDPAKKYTAVIKTAKGEVICELFPKEAPISVTNFKQLAEGGFYDGLAFHRVVPGFVIQGGDPDGNGTGGPGYTVPAEINPAHKHVKGALAWARTGDQVNPERRSSGSQFYITLEPTPFLDGAYTVFGQVTSGLDVTEMIRQGDKIETIVVRVE